MVSLVDDGIVYIKVSVCWIGVGGLHITGQGGLSEHLQTALAEAASPLPPRALRPYCGQLSEFQQKSILLVFAHSRRTRR